ncbi:hypothetical protein V6N13_134172 [Hibiscus sabdariffa]
MLQPITPVMSVLPGYMEWFYENGKPFIMTREARARVLRVPRPERPRQERGPRPTGASTGTAEQPGGAYTPAGGAGPSAEPYTPMPTQFQTQFTPIPPPTEGFFTGAFQPYSSMMVAPSILLYLSIRLHYLCIHRRVLPSVLALAMGWCNRHPQIPDWNSRIMVGEYSRNLARRE